MRFDNLYFFGLKTTKQREKYGLQLENQLYQSPCFFKAERSDNVLLRVPTGCVVLKYVGAFHKLL